MKFINLLRLKILNDNSGFSCFNGDNIEDINQSKNLNIYEIKQIGKDVLIKGTFLNSFVSCIRVGEI